MTDQAPGTGELTYTRVFDAPRELVFRCMLEPEHLTHFWGPAGVSTPLETIKVDARPGGVFETVMVNDSDGSRYPTRAVYVEIVEPERIVWTEPDSGVMTTSTFRDLGGERTELQIRQANAPAGIPQPRGAGGFRDLARPLRRIPRQARRLMMTTQSTDRRRPPAARRRRRIRSPGRPARRRLRRPVGYPVAVRGLAGPRSRGPYDDGRALLRRGIHDRTTAP